MEHPNTEIELVNIDNIRIGDTILHNNIVRTICNRSLKYDNFMGASIFGDSYKNGNILVQKIKFKTLT